MSAKCVSCGISQKDYMVLRIITEVLPGKWEITTHQGHIVKVCRKEREVTADELIKEHSGCIQWGNVVE